MAFSPTTGINFLDTGARPGAWGTITNINLQMLEGLAQGIAVITEASANIGVVPGEFNSESHASVYIYNGPSGGVLGGGQIRFQAGLERACLVINNTDTPLSVGFSDDASEVIQGQTSAFVVLENGAVAVAEFSGGVQWQATEIDETSQGPDRALEVGKGYFVDTRDSAITLTLPDDAIVGDTIQLVDIGGNAETNNITVTLTSSTGEIAGDLADFIVDINRAHIGLVVSSSGRWQVI